MELKVGDKVMMLKPVYECGEDLPRTLLADRGEILIVRRALNPGQAERRYAVGHEHTDGSFWAYDDEITPLEMTMEEAEAAYDATEPEPLSKEQIRAMVDYAVGRK